MVKCILISGILCFLALFLVFGCDKDVPITSETGNRTLDVSLYDLKLVYEADFSKSLKMMREDDLFKGNKRIKKPVDVDWVLEGSGSAWSENGVLHVTNVPINDKNMEPGNVVLWNTRKFPGNFLLELGFSPKDSNKGLAIVFFCATGRDSSDIFDLKQARRDGYFKKYHSGDINCYHVSYWAMPRKTTNLRKNYGKHLVASGKDNIGGQGPGPHNVRLLKVDGKIQLETRGQLVLSWQDHGNILSDGSIGLRTQALSEKVSYTRMKVWKVTSKK